MAGRPQMEGVEMNTVSPRQVEDNDIAYIHAAGRQELEMLEGKSVLVTGANGFLGYYYIKSMLAWNEHYSHTPIRIVALSRFVSGIPSWLVGKQRALSIVQDSIVNHVFDKDEVYDFIIHAASIASPIIYRKFPVETINANVQGMYRILEYMQARRRTKTPVSGLLYFSSSEIYGDPPNSWIPTPEEYHGNVSCTGPRACYDESKRFCETLSVNYAKAFGLPIKIARPFNNYGPGMKISDGRVIADFSKNIIEGKDIVLYSDGKPSRTYCYISDAIVGYMRLLKRGKYGEAYNIGVSGPEISVLSLAETMVEIAKKNYGYTGRIVLKKSKDPQYLSDNPSRRCPDISKAKKELGYNPGISLVEGLTRTLAWYKEHQS